MFNFIVLLIVIFGSLNWFAIGVFQFDLIAGIFGSQSAFFSRFVYTVIGLCGMWSLLVPIFKKGSVKYYVKKSKDKKSAMNALTEQQQTNPNQTTFVEQPQATTPPEPQTTNNAGTLVAEKTIESEKVYEPPKIRKIKASHPKISE